MDSPNYFLADLPPNADLTSPMILEACQTIRRNRLRYLAPRSTENLIRVLSDLAKSWLDPEFPFRKKALELGPGETGFSKETLSNGLDLLFAQLTPENFRALLIQEIGHVRRLDKFSTEDGEGKFPRASIARAPELIAHISGGVLPNPTLLSMVFGLLIRSAQFVKCGSGTSFLPRLFGHSLYQVEPKLASCLEIAEWKGGTAALDQTIFSVADLLTVTGSDETLQTIRGKIPAHLRLIDYGHRVSFAYITREIFSEADSSKIAKSAAEDVVAWDQLGCLSPHVIFVETGGKISPNRFAEMLANEFAEVEKNTPRGKLSPEVSATIAYRRSFYEIRAANSAETQLWSSANSTE